MNSSHLQCALQYNFEALVLDFSISILFYFILLLFDINIWQVYKIQCIQTFFGLHKAQRVVGAACYELKQFSFLHGFFQITVKVFISSQKD